MADPPRSQQNGCRCHQKTSKQGSSKLHCSSVSRTAADTARMDPSGGGDESTGFSRTKGPTARRRRSTSPARFLPRVGNVIRADAVERRSGQDLPHGEGKPDEHQRHPAAFQFIHEVREHLDGGGVDVGDRGGVDDQAANSRCAFDEPKRAVPEPQRVREVQGSREPVDLRRR